MNIKFKTECGIVYYTEDVDEESKLPFLKAKWKMAGREGHPLTQRYIELLKGGDPCVCSSDCVMEE